MEPLFVLLIATKYKEKWNQLCHTLHDIQFNQFWQEFNFFCGNAFLNLAIKNSG